jgi:hypothetical protein
MTSKSDKILSAELCVNIFFKAIEDYHVNDSIDTPENNPYDRQYKPVEFLLYKKNWIDTVQWHLEDVIRNPQIDPAEALSIKRIIDSSNQKRNDTVEKIDEWLIEKLKNEDIPKKENSRLNSESPAWIIDRISIVCLKIYHMEKEIDREDASDAHRSMCMSKLFILKEQLEDLSLCFTELLDDILEGTKYMKVYRQMKMYNDPSMNPVLYKNAPEI